MDRFGSNGVPVFDQEQWLLSPIDCLTSSTFAHDPRSQALWPQQRQKERDVQQHYVNKILF